MILVSGLPPDSKALSFDILNLLAESVGLTYICCALNAVCNSINES